MNNKGDGLADAIAVKKIKNRDYTPQPKKTLGTFGIVENGHNILIHWVLSDRKDRRHGVVGQPAPKDPYCEYLFETMFRKWD